MSNRPLDVLGVGNAIVDVLTHADDAFLEGFGAPKGGMTLIDEEKAAALYRGMGQTTQVSGGSAANTVACIASLGGAAGFVGKVFDDDLGHVFRHDLRGEGVEFDTAPATTGPATGRCLIAVTPDAQRTMATFLGAAGGVTVDDIDPAQIARAKILYFEGYLFEQPEPRKAFVEACRIAREKGVKAALTLSDAGCVKRQHAAFTSFIRENVDILFANEAELCALAEEPDFDAAAAQVNELVGLAALTRSEKGAVVAARGEAPVAVPAHAVSRLVDTTGAGDAYAGGFLHALARGARPEQASRLGALAASEIISHFGARPEVSLSALAKDVELSV